MGYYDEGTVTTPFLNDFVPLDSYDFTGLAGAPGYGHESEGLVVALRSPNDGSSPAGQPYAGTSQYPVNLWKFVYPDLYNLTVGAGLPRQIRRKLRWRTLMPLRMSRPRPPRLISARPTRTAPTPTISPESRSVITTGQGIPVLRIYSPSGAAFRANRRSSSDHVNSYRIRSGT